MLRNLLIILFFVQMTAIAQNTYEFLRLDVSPRAAALGGSFVANNDDPNVIFYNPAGIKSIEGRPASFSFLKHLLDINSASVSYSQEIEGIGRFAGGIQYINYGNFTEADQFGNKTGEFGAAELAMVIGYANSLDENFNYGANVKFIYSGIADQSSMGLALDLGLQYILAEAGWRFGLSVLNIGSQVSTYFDKSENLPLDVRIGLSKSLEHTPFEFYLSLNKLNEDTGSFGDRFSNVTAGAEVKLSKVIMLRFGYDNEKRKELKVGTTAGLSGFHLGLGVNVSSYRVDYAFSSMGSIGALHRIGVSTNL